MAFKRSGVRSPLSSTTSRGGSLLATCRGKCANHWEPCPKISDRITESRPFCVQPQAGLPGGLYFERDALLLKLLGIRIFIIGMIGKVSSPGVVTTEHHTPSSGHIDKSWRRWDQRHRPKLIGKIIPPRGIKIIGEAVITQRATQPRPGRTDRH